MLEGLAENSRFEGEITLTGGQGSVDQIYVASHANLLHELLQITKKLMQGYRVPHSQIPVGL